jgi:hypothetical protein
MFRVVLKTTKYEIDLFIGQRGDEEDQEKEMTESERREWDEEQKVKDILVQT